MLERFVEWRVSEALADTPVVLVIGPRRAGKTTLVKGMATGTRAYVTLDDGSVLDAARADPTGFVRGLDSAVIDEVQRVPELLLAIKKAVDEDNRPGRFLLTGSANVLTLPRIADSLAGRIEAIQMLPLAQAERLSKPISFLDGLFAGKPPRPADTRTGRDLIDIVLKGGFPEALARASERRRQDWLRSYLTSILTRDVRDIANVDNLVDLPKFVRLLAEHTAQTVNYSQFGNGVGITHKTSQRYVGLLEQVFLVATVQPWFTNTIKRIGKTPKLHFLDTGVLAAVRGLSIDRVEADRNLLGPLLETFVFSEILKLMTGAEFRLTPYHFRDRESREVDIVLERDDGTIAGIEVKASATVKTSDFVGMRALADACGKRFAFGAVLYDGDDIVPFGDRLAAVPVSSLWN